ncbi:HD domain-containing protein [Thalassospira sp. MA62]|nr:HD domain-containing protein [Thalassospira sp. MA62]
MIPDLRATLYVLSESTNSIPLPELVLGVNVCVLDPAQPIPANVTFLLADIDLKNPVSVKKVRDFRKTAPDNHQIFVTVTKGDRQHLRQANAIGARKTVLKPLSEIGLATIVGQMRKHLAPRAEDAKASVGSSARALRGLFEQASQKGPLDTTMISETGRQLAASVADIGVLGWLDTVRTYHHSTFQHVLLVTGIASAFGQGIGMTDHDIGKLTQAGLLHDIGKIWTPAHILDKPGKLTPEEFAIVKRHPTDGYRRLARQGDIDADILDAVLHHHEHLDGKGYPDGLKGSEINDLTRILTVCDIMAALLEKRAYKTAFSVPEALAVLFKMANQGKVERALVAALASVFKCAEDAIRLPQNDLLDQAPN